MKHVHLTGFGDPSVLTLKESEIPVPNSIFSIFLSFSSTEAQRKWSLDENQSFRSQQSRHCSSILSFFPQNLIPNQREKENILFHLVFLLHQKFSLCHIRSITNSWSWSCWISLRRQRQPVRNSAWVGSVIVIEMNQEELWLYYQAEAAVSI